MGNRKRLGILLCVCLFAGTVWACIWDTDTLRDELQTNADDFDLIAGQFPHHGRAYYEARLKRLEHELSEGPDDVDTQNDFAVALLKLGRYDESLRRFQAIEQAFPGRYETLSNLGVLHKKMGRLEEATRYTIEALKMKPAGHLGLGDDYVRMLRWRVAAEKNELNPEKSYFDCAGAFDSGDEDEVEGWTECDKRADRARKMIRADRHFPDALVVLGDHLRRRYDLNLALWAYVRALDLGHPNHARIHEGIDGVRSHWESAINIVQPMRVQDRDTAIEAVSAGLKEAHGWLEQFEAVEAELVAKHGDEAVDFAKVEAELQRRGIERFRPSGNIGIVSDFWAFLRPFYFGVVALIFGLSLLLRWDRRRLARKRGAAAS